MKNKFSRRHFLASASALTASAAVTGFIPVSAKENDGNDGSNLPNGETRKEISGNESFTNERYTLNLAPAKWIWYPAMRILPNTFFHFLKNS